MNWLWLTLHHALAMLWMTFWALVLGLFAIGLSGLLIDALLRTAETRLIPWRGRA